MQLSYNLIRKNQALSSNSKVISTEYVKGFDIEDDKEDIICKQSGKTIEEIEDILSNYESIGNSIVLEAKRKKDEIMYKALEESQAMEREAYEKGYAQGKENGYEDGKKEAIVLEAKRKKDEIMYKALEESQAMEREAYEKGYAQGKENGYEDGKKEAIENILPQVERQAAETIKKADEILEGAKEDYIRYLESKKEDIIRLSIAIAEKVIRKKVTDEDGISEILEEGIRLSKGEENLVIKCNPKYVSSIKEHIPVWKASYSISGEIFVLPNEGVSLGNAIIEKASGKVEVGIDVSLKAIECGRLAIQLVEKYLFYQMKEFH